MESSITLLHLGPPNSVEIDVIEYPVEKYPELAASLQQPNDVAGAPARLTQLPATITCVRLRFQDRELASQIQTLQSLLDEKEEKLQEARWKEESHAEVLQDWMLQMRELEKANGDLQEQAAKASQDLQKQADDAERLQESVQGQIKSLETELGATRRGAALFGAERSALERELEELKSQHVRLEASAQTQTRNLEIELGASRRNAVVLEAERSTLQKRLEELHTQNQELARAYSATRGQMLSMEEVADNPSMEKAADNAQSELTGSNLPIPGPPHSPGSDRPLTPEHETLKSSLSHAQRVIQTLRTNVHQEKTEKIELKRMLQDARDELKPQPASQMHDIEFAAEISTSLIAQVRNLQALLSEREEKLKEVETDRSRLELEVEGFQRLVVDNARLTERRTATRNPSIGGKITPSLVYSSTSDEEQSDFQANVQPDVHTAAEVMLPNTLLGPP